MIRTCPSFEHPATILDDICTEVGVLKGLLKPLSDFRITLKQFLNGLVLCSEKNKVGGQRISQTGLYFTTDCNSADVFSHLHSTSDKNRK